MEGLIDLHIHTNISDGTFSPLEVIDEAKKNGVTTIAIADHDTVAAYTTKTIEYAKKAGIKLIPAVEISTKINKVGIHVLGYNIDVNNKELKEELASLRNARHDYLCGVCNLLQKLGYSINFNKLNKIDSVTKAHIAEDIITNPKNFDILKQTFNHIPNKGEFIETIMNEGCIAYYEKKTITPKEASTLIKKASGKVVLAHPVAYTYENNLKEEDIESLVKDMEADGIEANYIYIDRNNNKIDATEKWNKFANKNNLFTTIGSDFHNKDRIHPQIGLLKENIKLRVEIKDKMLKELIN